MAEGKKVLIVEDDEDISMIEEAYLEAAGFHTEILSDGKAVLSRLKQESFDLILLDLMLPGKNGYEICREIREEVDIPILMVTARTESVDKIRGLGLGADDYIAKPFDPAELVARVHANLRLYERVMARHPAKERGGGGGNSDRRFEDSRKQLESLQRRQRDQISESRIRTFEIFRDES